MYAKRSIDSNLFNIHAIYVNTYLRSRIIYRVDVWFCLVW